MSDTTRELLIHGVASAKAGEAAFAYRYLTRMLTLDPDTEELYEAWYWLSVVSLDPKEQRSWIEELLANNPSDARARRRIAMLDGKLTSDEIINPDLSRAAPKPDQIDRFICPQCGGRMSYTPDGQSLTCDYCNSQNIGSQSRKGSIEQDFTLTMATARGHQAPVTEQTYDCQGCGANFILPAGDLSIACPHCDSTYVVRSEASKEYISPGTIVIFSIDEDEARKALLEWFRQEKFEDLPRVKPATALYIPVWEFNVGGMITWRYERYENKRLIAEVVREPIMQTGILVSALKNTSPILLKSIKDFDLDQRKPYDRSYLANWSAETYQVTVGDASLEARSMALVEEQHDFSGRISERIVNISHNSADMLVESFQLLLLPVWITSYTLKGERFEVIINGQNGKIRAQKPANGISGWFQNLISGE